MRQLSATTATKVLKTLMDATGRLLGHSERKTTTHQRARLISEHRATSDLSHRTRKRLSTRTGPGAPPASAPWLAHVQARVACQVLPLRVQILSGEAGSTHRRPSYPSGVKPSACANKTVRSAELRSPTIVSLIRPGGRYLCVP